jgi:hypothetical protein
MSKSCPAGFFTGVSPDRYQLPHRRLGLPVILLIRRVLCVAFEIMEEKGIKLAEAKEDDLTACLRSIIENDLRQTGRVDGFNKCTYEYVVRQAEVANYNGSRRAKTPDLCFKLRYDDFAPCDALSEFDALFVECKPVDKAHSAGSKYCDDGLNRFVNGDYAWAMQEGMMLAYARHGRTLVDHLITAMKESNRMIALATEQLPEDLFPGQKEDFVKAGRIYVSLHRRKFQWPDGKGPATNITIYHLWFDCN